MTSRASSRWRSWRRRLVLAVCALLGVAVSILLALWLGLQTTGFRRALLAWGAGALETETGILVAAEDYRLELLGPRLWVDGLTIAARGSADRPFLSAGRLEVESSWHDLLTGPLTIHLLALEEPLLDLGAPLPEGTDPPTGTEETTDPGPVLERLEIRGGSVLGPPVPDSAEIWADSWRADELVFEGSIAGDRVTVRKLSSHCSVQSSRRPVIQAELSARGAFSSERLEVEELRVEGEGLLLDASGAGPLDGSGALELRYAIDLALGKLFPDLGLEGRADSEGDISLVPAPEGSISVRSRVAVVDFPAVLLEPWLEALRDGDLTAAGTSLDLRGTLAIDTSLTDQRRDLDELEADLGVVWRRAEDELLTARVRTLEPDAGGGVRLAFDADLLPDSPGTRRLEGRLEADHWRELPMEGRFRATELILDAPDLETTWSRLGISPEALDGWLPAGALSVSLRAEGTVSRPDLQLRTVWTLDGEEMARISVEGRPGLTHDRDPGLDLTAEARLLPGLTGRRELSAKIHLPDWTEPKGSVARKLETRLELPDVRRFAREVLARLPDAFPERFPEEVMPDDLEPVVEALLEGHLTSRVEIQGPLLQPRVSTEGDWRLSAGESVTWRIAGEISRELPWLHPEDPSRIEVTGLDLSRLEALLGPSTDGEPSTWRPLSGRLSALVSTASSGPDPRLTLEATGSRIVLGELLRVDRTTLRAALVGELLTLESFDALLQPGAQAPAEPATIAATGWLELERPVRRAVLRFELGGSALGAEVLSAEAALEDGILALEASTAGLGRLATAIPLGTLSRALDRPGFLDDLLVKPAAGPVEVEIEELSLGRLQEIVEASIDREPAPTRLEGRVNGSLRLDPTRPAAADGSLVVTGLALQTEEDRFEVDGDLRLVARDGSVELPATSWKVRGEGSGAPLELAGRLELAPSWSAGTPVSRMLKRLDAAISGSVDAAVLRPFLGGGVATGRISVDAEAEGPFDDLTASVRLTGPEARIVFPGTYPTLIEEPEISVRIEDGNWHLETGRLKLNGGETEIRLGDLEGGGRMLEASIDGARYRLDHGLIADLSGELALRMPPTGRRLLSGRITLERGVLRRDIVLEREILRLAGGSSLVSVGDDFFSTTDLDLDLTTLDGIWIRNNLADLHLDWSLVRIRGSMREPQIAGRIDIESGGILTSFGQTVRIDEASLTFSGDPEVPPRLELETTSSLEDPRLGQNQANFWATGLGEQGPGMGGLWDSWYGQGQSQANVDELTTGLAGHYGNLFAESLVGGMNRVQLSFQPVPVLGETDSQARLTVAYHASPNVTLYTSQNPRKAEGRTEVLDLAGFSLRPSLRAQIFNNDYNRSGATLQETIVLGGGKGLFDDAPRVRSISVGLPSGRARRRLKRSIGLRKGDPFPSGSELHVEVDAIEGLRQRGYPGASVQIAATPSASERIDLEIGVIPGTAVRYEFAGEKLPRRTRRSVRSLFQLPEMDRGASLSEMEAEIARTLRSRGHIHPEVEVSVEPDPEAELVTVRISSRGGAVIDPELCFPDLEERDGALLAARFPDRLARVELAADLPGAREFLLRSLRGMGFRGAEILSNELTGEGRTLTVRLDPGHLRRIASVEVEGMDPDEAESVLTRLGIEAGRPYRSGVLIQATLVLEDLLREKGHLGARVESDVENLEDSDTGGLEIRLLADAGPVSRVGAITMEGLKASNPAWVRRKLGLEEGSLLAESDLQAARRRLSRTGVFHRIGVSSASEGESGERTDISLELAERPRFMLGIGARWEEEKGLGLVVDAVDRHFLGRGQTFGARLSYSRDDQRLRFFHAMPLPGEKTLELFLEGRDEVDQALGGLETRAVELWAQVSLPLTAHADTRVYGVARRRRFRREGFDEGLLDPEDNTPFVGWQILYDTRGGDRGDKPPRKWNLFYGHDLIGFWEDLGGDSTGLGLFTQLKLDVPLKSLEKGPISWVQSYRTGWIEAFEGELPFVDRLRAGGEYSVRGYPSDSLGPTSPEGIPLGGEFMVVLNQELHVPLTARIAGIAFFDAGNVWLNRSEIESSLFKSVGLGLRAASPIGPLRLDLAFPLDRREDDPSYKIYVGFGPTF